MFRYATAENVFESGAQGRLLYKTNAEVTPRFFYATPRIRTNQRLNFNNLYTSSICSIGFTVHIYPLQKPSVAKRTVTRAYELLSNRLTNSDNPINGFHVLTRAV